MISCAVSKGNTNSPISNFNCLKEDVPFLPKNYFGHEILPLNINLNTLDQISLKENSLINKITFNDTDNAKYISVNNIKIYGIDDNQNENHIEYNKQNFAKDKKDIFDILAPLDEKFYIGDYSFIKGIKLSIQNIIKEEKENVRDVKKIHKIIITFTTYKDNNITENKEITLNIEDKEDSVYSKNHFIVNGFVPNGSTAFVMDTSEVYIFDEDNDVWLKI